MKLVVALLGLASVIAAVPARAQEPPPRIPIIVVDVQGSVPRFPRDPLLADSRGLAEATAETELPGTGIGGQLGAHVYFFKFKAITVGVGGQALVTRSRQTPPEEASNDLKAVTEKFRTLGAQ